MDKENEENKDKKTNVLNNNSFILLLITILTGTCSIFMINYFYWNNKIKDINNNFEKLYEINTRYNPDNIYKHLIESQFKDDLVLNNLSTSIAIVIAFFTVLIALGTYLSFKRIDDDINKLKKSAKEIKTTAKQVEKAKKEIEITKKEVEDTQSEIERIKKDFKLKIDSELIKLKNIINANEINTLLQLISDIESEGPNKKNVNKFSYNIGGYYRSCTDLYDAVLSSENIEHLNDTLLFTNRENIFSIESIKSEIIINNKPINNIIETIAKHLDFQQCKYLENTFRAVRDHIEDEEIKISMTETLEKIEEIYTDTFILRKVDTQELP